MNINVSSIISNIETAIKASQSSTGDVAERRIPREIDPSRNNAKDPEYSFRGKTLIGRMYVDAKGTPFRSIAWLSEVFMPYTSESGEIRGRTISIMAPSNFIGLKEDERELVKELENTIREVKRFIPPYQAGREYKKGTPIVSITREATMFYFKPQMIINNGSPMAIPSLGAGSYISAKRQGLLQKILAALQTENQMNADGWADKAIGRDGLNSMNILLQAFPPQSKGMGWSYNFEFKSAPNGTVLTAEDLEASKDIDNEFIPRIFNPVDCEDKLNWLKEQIAIRDEAEKTKVAMNGVELPNTSATPASEFAPVGKPVDADVDVGDVPY